jgi:hypothetical protein
MSEQSISPLTYRDAELFGDAPLNDSRAKREEFVPAQYVGKRKDLFEKKGDSYFDHISDKWMFRVKGESEWIRVNFDSLRFIRKRVKKRKTVE